MRIHQADTAVKTQGRVSVENVTGQVRSCVERSGIRDGFVLVTVPHTTCGLAVNEDEDGLRRDIIRLAGSLLTPLAGPVGFEHDHVDNNAQAHLTAILLGHSVHLPVTKSAPVLGTWQSVFLVEMDGPRTRRLDIRVFGE
jgi:secondary thiamine-phosphate synthase enzyme